MKMAGSALFAAAGADSEAGVAAAIAAAARIPIIHHLPKGRLAAGKAIRKGAWERPLQCKRRILPVARKPPLFTRFAHQTPPGPILGNYGHQQLNKSLAKSAKRELFSTDGGERKFTADYWTRRTR